MLYVTSGTPRRYANAVQAHSEQSIADSLYPGHNFGSLASYLLEPFQTHAPSVPAGGTIADPRDQNDEFAALYRLGKKGAERFRYLKTPEELDGIDNDTATSDVDGPVERTRREEQEGSSYDACKDGRLLFLRGNASPEWLNRIGAKYHVDPEFFCRHRDFAATIGRPDYFSSPSLPSTNLNMLRLRVTTIGVRKARGRTCPLSQRELDAMRKEARASLREYFDGLSRQRNPEAHLGDSIVRDFSIHDKEYFSIEQNISIYITAAQRGWIGIHPERKRLSETLYADASIAIIWLDVGNDLNRSPPGLGTLSLGARNLGKSNISPLFSIAHESR